eukprot:6431232-Alexandrium_andersonii.AAC.1
MVSRPTRVHLDPRAASHRASSEREFNCGVEAQEEPAETVGRSFPGAAPNMPQTERIKRCLDWGLR